MKVRLIGVEPNREPAPPRGGWYFLDLRQKTTVAGVLDCFKLDPGALSVLKNGLLAAPGDTVDDRDELQIFLKSLGG